MSHYSTTGQKYSDYINVITTNSTTCMQYETMVEDDTHVATDDATYQVFGLGCVSTTLVTV